MPPALQFLVFTAAGWLNRHQEDLIDYLREENRVLREQLGGRPLRLTDAQRRRLAVRGQTLGRRVLTQVAGIVTPDTILRWYRRLIAQKYDGSARRRRPSTPQAIAELVVRMAVENPRWGYTRIRGALANLGHEIGRNTVKRILCDHGIAPAPEDRPWSRTRAGFLLPTATKRKRVSRRSCVTTSDGGVYFFSAGKGGTSWRTLYELTYQTCIRGWRFITSTAKSSARPWWWWPTP